MAAFRAARAFRHGGRSGTAGARGDSWTGLGLPGVDRFRAAGTGGGAVPHGTPRPTSTPETSGGRDGFSDGAGDGAGDRYAPGGFGTQSTHSTHSNRDRRDAHGGRGTRGGRGARDPLGARGGFAGFEGPGALGGPGGTIGPGALDGFSSSGRGSDADSDPGPDPDLGTDAGTIRITGVPVPGRRRPRWAKPVRFAVAATLAVGMIGGAAFAAGTGVLPLPFDGDDRRPTAAAEGVPGRTTPSPPAPSPSRSAADPSRPPASGAGRSVPKFSTEPPLDPSAGPNRAAGGTQERMRVPTDWRSGQVAACRAHERGKLDAGGRRGLESAARGPDRVARFCERLLARYGGEDRPGEDDPPDGTSETDGDGDGGDQPGSGGKGDDDGHGTGGGKGEGDGEGEGRGEGRGRGGSHGGGRPVVGQPPDPDPLLSHGPSAPATPPTSGPAPTPVPGPGASPPGGVTPSGSPTPTAPTPTGPATATSSA